MQFSLHFAASSFREGASLGILETTNRTPFFFGCTVPHSRVWSSDPIVFRIYILKSLVLIRCSGGSIEDCSSRIEQLCSELGELGELGELDDGSIKTEG